MNDDGTGAIATLHLWRVPARAAGAAASRMALDRPALRARGDLRFWKLLGTGKGRTFTVTDADLRRWALFAVWDSVDALAAFEESDVTRRWSDLSDERWRATLRPLRWRGQWSGRDPFRDTPALRSWDGPVAALTRARIRPLTMLSFWRAVPPVAAQLQDRQGLRLAIGIGELPVGVQGTFSVWESAAALSAFAYAGPQHRDAIAQTERRRWYAEELFARFAVIDSDGAVDGRDPLPGVTAAS